MPVFGPSRREVWRQLSEQLGGDMHSSWRGDKVQVAHERWTVTFDTHAIMANNTPVYFTRLRAPLVNRSGFRFSVKRRNVLTDIAVWLGAQDVEVGEPEFDQQFVIKSNHEARVRELLRDEGLRRQLEGQPSLSVTIKDDEGWFGAKFPEGVDELYFSVNGLIDDIDRLKDLFELFALTLDCLVAIGSADAATPDVTL